MQGIFRIEAGCRSPPLLVMNFKGLVGNEDDRDILVGSGPVFHDASFRKPDEMSRSILTVVGHKRSLQNKHSMRTGMCMQRVDCAGRVAYQPDLHTSVGVRYQVLAIERTTYPFVGALLPR